MIQFSDSLQQKFSNWSEMGILNLLGYVGSEVDRSFKTILKQAWLRQRRPSLVERDFFTQLIC